MADGRPYRRLLRLPRRGDARIRADVDAELAFHLEQQVADLMASGMSEAEAWRAAEAAFGDVQAARVHLYAADAAQERRIDVRERAAEIRRDAALGLRQLRRTPALSAAVLLILALSIGATTAIYSVVRGVLQRPLPYPSADRLVVLWQEHGATGEERAFNPADFELLRSSATLLERVASRIERDAVLRVGAGAERISAPHVSHEYLPLFGVVPQLGRVLVADDEYAGEVRAVVLGERLWRTRFGSDPGVVGSLIELDDVAHRVVGVASPEAERGGGGADLWVAAAAADADATRRFYLLRVFGRLVPGGTVLQAEAELARLAAGAAQAQPEWNGNVRFHVELLHDRMVARVRPALFTLFAAVVFLQLLACTQLANLLLARASARRQELMVRSALGAGRSRILRQLLTESLVFAALGGILGIVVAYTGLAAARVLAAEAVPRMAEVTLDPIVLLFAAALCAAIGVACGIWPARHAARVDMRRGGASPGTRSGAGEGMRAGLVVAALAITVVLLMGAGLTIGSFFRLTRVEPGFDAAGVLTAELNLPAARFNAEAVAAFHRTLLERLESEAGVVTAGLTTALPLGAADRDLAVETEDVASAAAGARARYRIVSSGYLETMRITRLRGRSFTAADRAGAPGVVIVNRTLARSLWPGSDPIGRRLRPDWAGDEWFTVVGVAEDVRHADLAVPPEAELYFAAEQLPAAARHVTIVLRAEGQARALEPVLRSAVAAVDPLVPVSRVAMMSDRLGGAVALPRLYMTLFGGFAGLALLVSMAGLYGVIAFDVSRRTREIGVRMALGAPPRAVLAHILARGMRVAVPAVAIGVVCSLVLTRALAALLYEVAPTDAATHAAVVLLLIAVAALASLLPARRAARVDPMVALRSD